MKKILCVFCIFFFMPLTASALSLSAHSAVMIDADSGRILFSKNAGQTMTMASTTKIMTGLLAAEYGKGDEIVTVSQNAAYQEGSSMYLKVGEKVTVSELLWGLMLSSGNDAAVALAEHISGNVEKFAEKMTQRAKEIGAVQTSFKNPNGLDEEGHFTTALDMAKITAHAMKNELFAKTVSTNQITTERATYTNHNKLLYMYDGTIGVKTGYTKKSGRCLVSACERNGFKIIAVTLNAPDDWNDHMKMFDYAYENYQCVTPITGGSGFGEIMAENGEEVKVICENNIGMYINAEEQKRLEIISDLPPKIALPVRRGQTVGKVTVMLDGLKMGESALLADRDVLPPEKDDFYTLFIKSLKIFVNTFR